MVFLGHFYDEINLLAYEYARVYSCACSWKLRAAPLRGIHK